ncbi:hypothetical protein V0U79_13070 [Hyphobacterium sp. HN65]|uniref:Uncharacterized protein n=1 Tax=Hyphobacterium lacteum TaxID=3116575 RepID=A0ABU7LTP6_9PROT|nr:hypothetical protein [Hyphobacterium sp. HN65]MEE2527291.1 hypothetical protein [Hyphobacterium sp. HN65]
MNLIPAELDLVAVSAGSALIMGSVVRIFGARWLFSILRHVGGFAMRRRAVSTAVLGATASAGLAAASAFGLQPPEFGDAVGWFQSQFAGLDAAAEMFEAMND